MTKEKHFNDIVINMIEENDNFAKLTAEPFDRGYALTIGNTMRRILLTSIPGAAITSLKIDGIQHEFSNIKGVVEDVSQIIQNLKKVRFALNDYGPEIIIIEAEGPCKLTAKIINDHLTLGKISKNDFFKKFKLNEKVKFNDEYYDILKYLNKKIINKV